MRTADSSMAAVVAQRRLTRGAEGQTEDFDLAGNPSWPPTPATKLRYHVPCPGVEVFVLSKGGLYDKSIRVRSVVSTSTSLLYSTACPVYDTSSPVHITSLICTCVNESRTASRDVRNLVAVAAENRRSTKFHPSRPQHHHNFAAHDVACFSLMSRTPGFSSNIITMLQPTCFSPHPARTCGSQVVGRPSE